MYLREIGLGDMDWIDLAEDNDRCRALVNTVTFGLHKILGNYSVTELLAVSQEGLSSVELV
jgi:hypothetical protein